MLLNRDIQANVLVFGFIEANFDNGIVVALLTIVIFDFLGGSDSFLTVKTVAGLNLEQVTQIALA